MEEIRCSFCVIRYSFLVIGLAAFTRYYFITAGAANCLLLYSLFVVRFALFVFGF